MNDYLSKTRVFSACEYAKDADIGPTGQNNEHSTDKPVISNLRCILPQVLACTAMNMLVFGLGLSIGFPTIAIPAFRGLQADKYPNETIRLTAEESSCIVFMTEPLGSIFSGWITEQIGRKRSICLSLILPLTAWTILYFAQSPLHVFIAGALLGFGDGLLVVPMDTYCVEITQPSIRGIMMTINSMSMMTGIFLMFLMGSFTSWRNASLVGLAIPLVTIVLLSIIPESPQWLIAQNRKGDALKSLRWLRGWAPAENVESELEVMTAFIAQSNACDKCQIVANGTVPDCTHKVGYFMKIKDICRTKTLRPLGLIMFCFCVTQSSGNAAIRPFLVQIFKTFRIPMDANWGSVLMGLVDIVSNLFCVIAIPIVGKRRIMLIGLFGVFICCFGVAINAYFYLSFDTTSFENHTFVADQSYTNPYAFALFVCLGASASISGCVPLMMNSEVFPFKVRGTASGLSLAYGSFTVFLATKTYIYFEHTFSICGSFIVYGGLTLFGLIVLFNILPNTEGHKLEEIENFFSDKTRKLTDRRIQSIRTVDLTKSWDNPEFEKSGA